MKNINKKVVVFLVLVFMAAVAVLKFSYNAGEPEKTFNVYTKESGKESERFSEHELPYSQILRYTIQTID